MVPGGDGKTEGISQATFCYPLSCSYTPPHRPHGTLIVPGIPLPPQERGGVNREQELFLNWLRGREHNVWQLQAIPQRVGKTPELIPDDRPIPFCHKGVEKDASQVLLTLQ
jgi:hypothetical protein